MSSDKIKIAFVKFGGLSAGGTEKFLQQLAANLPTDKFAVDYFYCDAAPYIGSDYQHMTTDPERLDYMRAHNVNLIKFNVKYKDVTVPTHDWIDTDFWDKFKEENYDIVQTGRAGHSEYPFYKMSKVSIVDSIHLTGMTDRQMNIAAVVHISKWNEAQWIANGGDASKSRVIYLPIHMPKPLPKSDLRKELGLGDKVVFGMHQRADDGIYSDWPLRAYAEAETENTTYVLLGGSSRYVAQAKALGLKNFHHVPFSSNMKDVYKFLNTLDVYLHGRMDGEVNSQSIAEAMAFGKPVISHFGQTANGHVETIGNAGFVHGHFDSYIYEIMNFRDNKDFREWLGNIARKRFTDLYDLKSNINKFVKLYEEMVQKVKVSGHYSNPETYEPYLEDWINE